MAIFHFSTKVVSRSKGRSAVAAAAYRAGVRLLDERLGQTFDYRRKKGVLHSELVLTPGAPTWAADRQKLWNAAEVAETRKNSTVAREFEIALPSELPENQRQKLVMAFANELAERHRCAVDVAIHTQGKGGDNRNHHAHILCTTRRLTPDGFAEKTRELDEKKSGEVVFWRERWATLVNEELEAAAQPARVDHRSLADQCIDRQPTAHDGPSKTAIRRRLARRLHEKGEPMKLTNQQHQAADQLAVMRARLAQFDASKFQNSETRLKVGPTKQDYLNFESIKQRRMANQDAQPTHAELRSIDRILIEQARERLRKHVAAGSNFGLDKPTPFLGGEESEFNNTPNR